MKILKKTLILLILLILLIYIFNNFNMKNYLLKIIYPIKYEEYVEKYAEEYQIDSLLIYSIIKAESNFNKDAISNTKALGLMQIMEKTAYEKAKKINIKIENIEELYIVDINIKIGVSYFSELLKTYDNNLNLSLIAYNAGMGNLKKWIENGTIKKDGSDIENIPFEETKNYVRKILKNYEIYKKLY